MLYKNCRELPIHNFNEIELNNDLNYLIKDESKHSKEDLQSKWVDIYDEYLKLVGSNESRLYFNDYLDLHLLEIKKTQIEIALKIHNVCFEFNIKSEKYIKFIDNIKKSYRIKDLKLAHKVTSDKLKSKISDFKIKYSTNNNNKEGIDDLIPILIERGYNIDRHRMVVSEWCGILKRLKEQAKSKEQNVR